MIELVQSWPLKCLDVDRDKVRSPNNTQEVQHSIVKPPIGDLPRYMDNHT